MYRNKVFESYFWCCFLVLHFPAKVHENSIDEVQRHLKFSKSEGGSEPLTSLKELCHG